MSNNLLKKTKLLVRNTFPSQYLKIKRVRKPSIIRLVTTIKSISKFKLFKYLKFKKRLFNNIRKSRFKHKTKKGLKVNKFKNSNKRKINKRYRKSRFFKRNKIKRFIRVSKRRKFLNKVRSRRFKYNKKLSRKKLIRRFNSRKVTKLLKRRILFISSRKAVKLANKKLLVRFLNESYLRRLNLKKNKKYYSLNTTLSKMLKGPKVLKVLFDSISFKLDNLALKQYVIKSSIFLRMTEEEKLAYLDKRNMPLAEKLKMLNS